MLIMAPTKLSVFEKWVSSSPRSRAVPEWIHKPLLRLLYLGVDLPEGAALVGRRRHPLGLRVGGRSGS